MHLVVLPLSIVAASLGVVEFAISVPLSILLEALVLGADLVLLNNKFALCNIGVLFLHLGYGRYNLLDVEGIVAFH
jgi:hypothetical protein